MKYRIAILLLVAFLGASCSVRQQTVTPPPIVSTQASADGNAFNSGDVSFDADGAIKSGHWLERYDAMLAIFGKRFTPEVKPGDRNGIAMVSENQYRVTAQVSVRFTRMNQWRKADQTLLN